MRTNKLSACEMNERELDKQIRSISNWSHTFCDGLEISSQSSMPCH